MNDIQILYFLVGITLGMAVQNFLWIWVGGTKDG